MRLKKLRENKGLTQLEVARAIGCSANTYARYERGEREADYHTLRQLARFFSEHIDYIIGDDIGEF